MGEEGVDRVLWIGKHEGQQSERDYDSGTPSQPEQRSPSALGDEQESQWNQWERSDAPRQDRQSGDDTRRCGPAAGKGAHGGQHQPQRHRLCNVPVTEDADEEDRRRGKAAISQTPRQPTEPSSSQSIDGANCFAGHQQRKDRKRGQGERTRQEFSARYATRGRNGGKDRGGGPGE